MKGDKFVVIAYGRVIETFKNKSSAEEFAEISPCLKYAPKSDIVVAQIVTRFEQE